MTDFLDALVSGAAVEVVGLTDAWTGHGEFFAADAVLVGERCPTGEGVFPASTRSGSWLREALVKLGARVVLANLHVPRDDRQAAAEPEYRLNADLLALLRHRETGPVVALGRDVAAELARQGILHYAVPHPAWHRRFRRAEGPAGYAAHLAAALEIPAPVQ